MLLIPPVALNPAEKLTLHPDIQADSARDCERLQNLFAQSEAPEAVTWLVQVSPFIARVLQRYGEAANTRLLAPAAADREILRQGIAEQGDNEVNLMRFLRCFRHIEMARIAALDLLGRMPLGRMLAETSALADMLIEETLAAITDSLAARYGRALDDNDEELPLIVLAMGKLGGEELNFSSDIDLIFSFPNAGETRGGRQAVAFDVYYQKVAQQLLKLLGQPTADGQPFRIDMRLRPFGQSGPLVASLSALEDYYHEQGRMWERYAMIKARVLNTSADLAEQVRVMLRPFIYRRYLDYSAIDALRKMKLLINQEARRKGVADNIKLGPGGIREVEFVTQVFQLIRGGRENQLQTRSLLAALSACEDLQHLEAGAIADLLQGYSWLRKLEHVLQQINDEQTQTLPKDWLTRWRVLAACGYAQSEEGWQALLTEAQEHMAAIHRHFIDAIGGEEDLQAMDESEFAILWQDLLADETAIEVLTEAGARDPQACWQAISEFRTLLRKRPSGPRGRELQANLVPALIEGALKYPHAEQVLPRVFEVLGQIVSRTTYLELLAENRDARRQLTFLCQASPWIAHLLAKFPLLLDELIDPVQLYQLPAVESYRHRVSEYLLRLPVDDAEAQMDALRQVKQIFQLKVAAADLNEGVHLMRVSDHLTFLAEAIIEQVVLLAWRQLTATHGCPPGRDESDTGFAVIAYGKLGGYELGYGSDLDLVFISADDNQGETDGAKPLDVQQFYLRLAQRVLHLFTTRTMTGVLYDVDMRLRPSGQAGLLVVRASTLREYLVNDAWTWELQALVRARMVYGHASLYEQFSAIRKNTLCRARDLDSLRSDVLAMRDKMRNHLWQQRERQVDVKQMPGGVADIEFITQYLVLANSQQVPDLAIWTDNIRILEIAAAAKLLSEGEAIQLIEAYQVYRIELHRLALAEQGRLSERDFSEQANTVRGIWQRVFALSTDS